eukprot:CAMPEP_0115533904 /NCGR_PEP_ID=MMETSP0271-20121206/86379_1 /TAXON_ID=71861 /ORGANISM="Scrippsiella trochoidea, Strain CCMP3099" /LENGTH=42 /DNA_ID= /DNA_START= /DNA_END= /DNA_ORIENTATION=
MHAAGRQEHWSTRIGLRMNRAADGFGEPAWVGGRCPAPGTGG